MATGRDSEIARIRSAVCDAVDGGTGVLVLRGDPGIGKSWLLEHCAAAADGFRVVRVRGHEAERDIPFAALSMLYGPLTAETEELTPAQAAALLGAMSLGPAVHGDRMAVAGAVLALLAAAAERRPLLLAVDDVHQLDTPTVDALLFALRRLEHEPLAAVLTARPTVDVEPALERRLEQFPQLEITGLDLDTARRLTAHRGLLTEAEWAAAGGNPLALLELTAPRGAGLAFDEPLPVSARLQRAYRNRFDGLPEPTREALLLVATDGRADVLDDALADRGLSLITLEPAEEAALVVLGAGAVAFTHPLVRSAIYHSAPPALRRAAHRTLADAYARRSTHGAHSAVERRAFHLAAATTLERDEDVAAELATAAERAEERHGHTTAAALFEMAARCSPPGTLRTQRALRGAVAGQAAGTLDAAGPLLQLAITESDDEDMRTLAAQLQVRIQMWSGYPAQARDQLLDLADRTEVRHPEWSAAMRAQAAVVSIALGEMRIALRTAQRAVEVGSHMTDEKAVSVLVTQAVARGIAGDTAAAREMLARAAPHLPGCDPFSIDQPLVLAALAYACVEELAEAQRLLGPVVTKTSGVGATGLLPFQQSWLALIYWLTGDWLAARTHALSAVQAAEQTGWETELPNCLIALATVEATLGDEDSARKHTARAEELGTGQSPTRIFAGHAARVRGLLELGAGRYDEAAAHLDEAASFAHSVGIADPILFSWASNLAEALARAGRPQEARAAHRAAVAEAERGGRPTAHAVAARCAGLLATSLEEGRAWFQEALAWHDRAEAQPFERARTRLCFGELLRRHRRLDEARTQLRKARGGFAHLGAVAWLNRTQAELDASGDTTPRPSPSALAELTPQELQVAVLVAEGITNKEVGDRLFVSPRTVEFHLGNIYAKLGLGRRGRTALIRMMLDGR